VLEVLIKIFKKLRNNQFIRENEEELRENFVHHFCIILQMHFVVQDYVTLEIRIHDRLIVQIIAKILFIKVFFEIVAIDESSQAIDYR